jgi:hypothetical protein
MAREREICVVVWWKWDKTKSTHENQRRWGGLGHCGAGLLLLGLQKEKRKRKTIVKEDQKED